MLSMNLNSHPLDWTLCVAQREVTHHLFYIPTQFNITAFQNIESKSTRDMHSTNTVSNTIHISYLHINYPAIIISIAGGKSCIIIYMYINLHYVRKVMEQENDTTHSTCARQAHTVKHSHIQTHMRGMHMHTHNRGLLKLIQ